MRWFISIVFVVWASVVSAQSTDIEDVISKQIEAFRAGDLDSAYDFASPDIQSLFGSAERFGAMVRDGYPMVWRPSDFRFLELTEARGAHWQRVLVTDVQGVFHEFEYQMLLIEGRWRINGVRRLMKTPAV